MVVLAAGLLVATVAAGQPYDGQGAAVSAHPWSPAASYGDAAGAFDPALFAPAPGASSRGAYGGIGDVRGFASSGPYYGSLPQGGLGPPAGDGGYGPVTGPAFQPWTPDFPGAPNPFNTRSGGNPGMGFWEVAPTAFRYRRAPVTGGPSIYAHGWYTPWGDYEGVMIIRGNARGLFQGYGY